MSLRTSEAEPMSSAMTAAPRAKRRKGGADRSGWTAAAFITPSLFGYAVFVIAPTFVSIAVAFFDWDLFSPPQFAGLDNFARLFSDKQLAQAIGVTVEFIALGVAPTVLIGFTIAVGLNFRARGMGAIRVLYYTPIVVSAAVASIMWSWIFQPETGLLNSALRVVGVDGPSWLYDPVWAAPAITLMLIWLSLPLVVMLYVAAFQRIPEMLYEAAMIDGANAWQRMWHITWPSVRGMTLFVLLLQILGFAGAPVEISLIMTGGGPLASTRPLGLYIYQRAFQDGDVGYASALSFVQFLIFGVFGIALALLSRGRNRA